MLAIGDLGAGIAAGVVAWVVADSATGLLVFALQPVWLLLAKTQNLYGRDHTGLRYLTSDELGPLAYWSTFCVGATALVGALLPSVTLGVELAVVVWLTLFAATLLNRTAMRALWRKLVDPERALVLGEGVLADALTRKLRLEPGHNIEIAVQIPTAGGSGNGSIHDLLDSPSIRNGGRLDGLDILIDEARIERVLLARTDLDEELLATVISTCRNRGVKLSVAPPLRAMLGTAVNLNHLADLPVIEFRTWDAPRSTMILKRAFDLIAASFLLVLALPAMIVIALVVRLTSPGPTFFAQERAGRFGRPFRMYKFRTMVRDAEDRLHEVINLQGLPDPMFKIRADPRVTRVGRFLRKASLDELPQLLNVIRGDMSLVGPRPEEVRIVARYREPERFRLEMRPGITGPMQVHGRGELTFQERMAVEREYVENYSLSKDFRILSRTLAVVLRGKGAF
jgi:exopolysaccharide biosynthesis polyprenyl glycosylphosphotransferase